MNFLSNLWSGVKNVASKVASTVSGALGGSQAASPVFSARIGENLNSQQAIAADQSFGINKSNVMSPLTVPANYMAPGTVKTGATNAPGNQYTTMPVRPSTAKYAPQMTPAPAGTGYMTPAPANTATQQSGAQSSPYASTIQSQYSQPAQQQQNFDTLTSDRQYSLAELQTMAPQAAAPSGYSSFSPSNWQSMAPVASPFSGYSSFNGVTSGVGTFGSSPITQTTDSAEQQKKNKYQAQQSQMPQEVPAWLQQINNVLGTGMSEQPFSTPSAPTINNVGDILDSRKKTGPITSSSFAQRDSDLNTSNIEIKSKIQENLGKQPPPPENPVKPTKEQEDFLNNFQPRERISIQSQMDQMREALGITETQNAALQAQNAINAINLSYKSIYEDIKANPNLPKGLALRRLATVQDKHKADLDSLTATLQELNTKLKYGNDAMNFQLGIIKEQNAEDRDTQRANFDLLKLYTDSGAIGQFADEDIAKWSQATGIPAEQLRAVKTAASQPDTKIVEGNDGAFYKQTIGKDGKVSVTRVTNPISTADSSGEAIYSGMSAKSATAVRGLVSSFKGEKTAQNFATVQSGNNFASSFSQNSKNPVEHQALIYALAKTLDPDSVVREGEYATAQKYAQSWVSAFGKSVSQAINGTGFLSSDAITNIQSVIRSKYNAEKTSYDSLYNRYATGINNITGRNDGDKFLIDYRIDGGTTQSGSNSQQDLSKLSDGAEVVYDGKTYYKYGNELRGIEELFSPMK